MKKFNPVNNIPSDSVLNQSTNVNEMRKYSRNLLFLDLHKAPFVQKKELVDFSSIFLSETC